MIRRLFVLLVALTLAACGTREKAALETEVQRLRSERDKLAKIAENLDDFREEADRVAYDLARTAEMGFELEHQKRVDRLAGLPGVSRKIAPSGGTEIAGPSLESLQEARKQAGAIAVERLALGTGGTWTLTVPAYDTLPFQDEQTRGVHIPPPLPAAGRFSSRRSRALRAEIGALSKEVAELRKLGRGVTEFENDKRRLTMRLEVMEMPSRLNTIGGVAEALVNGKAPACRSGAVTVTNDNVRFWCSPHAADPDAGIEALRALFPDAGPVGGWHLGPVSIDPSNPEPIQGSLLRSK